LPTVSCDQCGAEFHVKLSRIGVAKRCSRKCHAQARRTRPHAYPRPCEVCGEVFAPARGRGDAKFCSRSCVWKATRGPEFNRRIAKEFAHKNGATQRGRGNGKTYTKFMGRHEHRVVAEKTLGRALLPGEVVHHIDGDKKNNSPENLAVMSQAEHMREHGLGIPGKPLLHEPWKLRGKK
jgi:hypothetical protein